MVQLVKGSKVKSDQMRQRRNSMLLASNTNSSTSATTVTTVSIPSTAPPIERPKRHRQQGNNVTSRNAFMADDGPVGDDVPAPAPPDTVPTTTNLSKRARLPSPVSPPAHKCSGWWNDNCTEMLGGFLGDLSKFCGPLSVPLTIAGNGSRKVSVSSSSTTGEYILKSLKCSTGDTISYTRVNGQSVCNSCYEEMRQQFWRRDASLHKADSEVLHGEDSLCKFFKDSAVTTTRIGNMSRSNLNELTAQLIQKFSYQLMGLSRIGMTASMAQCEDDTDDDDVFESEMKPSAPAPRFEAQRIAACERMKNSRLRAHLELTERASSNYDALSTPPRMVAPAM